MKLSTTAKKTRSAILLLLLMSGFYGAIIVLCNQYLRRHDLLSPTSKSVLIALLVIGFYLIYRWFSRRIDDLSKKKADCGRWVWRLAMKVIIFRPLRHSPFEQQPPKRTVSQCRVLQILVIAAHFFFIGAATVFFFSVPVHRRQHRGGKDLCFHGFSFGGVISISAWNTRARMTPAARLIWPHKPKLNCPLCPE